MGDHVMHGRKWRDAVEHQTLGDHVVYCGKWREAVGHHTLGDRLMHAEELLDTWWEIA